MDAHVLGRSRPGHVAPGADGVLPMRCRVATVARMVGPRAGARSVNRAVGGVGRVGVAVRVECSDVSVSRGAGL